MLSWRRKGRGKPQEVERVKALEVELAGVNGERDARAKEAVLAREEAELTLLQLHQIQEELEHLFLSDQQKQQRLVQGAKQFEESRERFEGSDSKT